MALTIFFHFHVRPEVAQSHQLDRFGTIRCALSPSTSA
jgi:hypothetical protein